MDDIEVTIGAVLLSFSIIGMLLLLLAVGVGLTCAFLWGIVKLIQYVMAPPTVRVRRRR